MADTGQGLGEGDHALVLRFVADRAPAGVVEVLLAAAGVAAGGLQMAVGPRADPDLGPGGRDRQRLDAAERFGVVDVLALGPAVAETAAGANPANPGAVVEVVAQSGSFGGL